MLIETGAPMKGIQHITRFKKQLHESYENIEQELLASHPNLSTSQIQTQLLLAFALDRIAGCPREEISTHITDGQHDEGIDAFYFNRGEKKVYVFQSKFIENPRHDPISETDSRAFIWGIHQLVRCTPDFTWENDALNYLKEEIYEALITDNVSFIPCLLSTSDNKVRDNSNTILNEGIKENLGDETELSYYNLSKLYELSSQYSGNNGVNIQIVLNGSRQVSDPYPAYYGWITGDTLSSLYKQHGQRLFSRNLRSGLGQTEVNQEIQNTIIDNPDHFWYFNNGVTIVANTIRRKMLHGHNSDVTELTLTDASIINGAQTTTTLGSLPSNEMITESLHILRCPVRLFEIPSEDEALLSQVTRYNNSQNGIGTRDFIALDPFQQQLRADLDADFAVSYLIRSGEPETSDNEETINLQEATLALVCCGSNVNYAVIAKRNISALWKDVNSTPYTDIFNTTTTTPLSLIKAVEAFRFVDTALKTLTCTDRDKGIQVHGNRLFEYYILHDIDIWDERIPRKEFMSKIKNIDLQHYFDIFVATITYLYTSDYRAPLFKNSTKCTHIIESLPDVTY